MPTAPGVLLLHGFTGSHETVSGLIPHLEAAGVPYRMPWLRGHGGRPEDLAGVTWEDWLEDGRRAMAALCQETGTCLPVGLSMGGLVALGLAAWHPRQVAGVATVAACLEFRSPLVRLTPLLARLSSWWPARPSFAAPGPPPPTRNYPRFPTRAFVSLREFSQVVKAWLPRVQAPFLGLQSSADPVVDPSALPALLKGISSEHREGCWFHRSHHEMMLDLEREEVYRCLMRFILAVRRGELSAPSPA